jgi:hypothetical protein
VKSAKTKGKGANLKRAECKNNRQTKQTQHCKKKSVQSAKLQILECYLCAKGRI